MKVPIGITGVWVYGTAESEKLAVCVEVDGQWRQLGTWCAKSGLTSHIIETAGIIRAPRVEIPNVEA